MANTTKPTIAIVPGAWHKAHLYQSLTNRLEQAGYTVHPLDYPSTQMEPANLPKNFDSSVTELHEKLAWIADRGEDIMVVVHSAGGLLGSEAAQGLSKADRQAKGLPGGIIRMFYMCAFAAPEGVAIFDVTGGPEHWHRVEDNAIYVRNPKETFYNLCPAAVAEDTAAQLGVFSKGTVESKQTYAAWKHIPSTYLICEHDQAIPVAGQEHMVSQPGSNFDVVRCGADHSPWLSMPDFTVEAVKRAAGEKL